MGYRNSLDYSGQNQVSGENAENIFESLAKKRNLKVKKASFSQQIAHIDFILTDKNNVSHFVDVKARKKISRSSSEFTDELIWIELKNGQGNNGWLHGSADFIAFERENDFVIASRKNLVILCERIISNSIVEKSSEALYKLYTRKGRKDLLSLIKMEDILNGVKTQIWQKQQ